MSNYTGLYYPFIHFRGGDDWVKTCALYWDEMHRIVPMSDRPDNSPIVDAFFRKEFVRDARPDELGESRAVGDKFLELLNGANSDLLARYAVTEKDTWPELPAHWKDPRDPQPDAETSEKLARIFYGKLPPDLIDKLILTGLAEDHPFDCELGMHPRLAFIFMTALAEEIAKERGYNPVTDSFIGQISINDCSVESLRQLLNEDVTPVKRGSGEIEFQLATIAVTDFASQAINGMTVDEIIAFRREHTLLLNSYREWIQSLVKNWDWIEGVKDEKTLNDRLSEQYEKEMKVQLDHLRDQMRIQRWETTASVLAITVAVPVLTNITGVFGLAADPALTSIGGISLGLTRVLATGRRAEDALDEKKGSFLVRLQNANSPNQVVANIRERAAKLAGLIS